MTIMTVYIDTDYVKKYPLDIEIDHRAWPHEYAIRNSVIALVGNAYAFDVRDNDGNWLSSSDIHPRERQQ